MGALKVGGWPNTTNCSPIEIIPGQGCTNPVIPQSSEKSYYALFAIHPQLLLVEALVDIRQKLTPSGRAEGMFVGVGWGRYVGAFGWLRSRMGRLHSMCVQLQSMCVYHNSLNDI